MSPNHRRQLSPTQSPNTQMRAPAIDVDRWSVGQMGDLLSRQLTDRRPLRASEMTPALAYGRHQGPFRQASRLAAVAVTLYQRNSRWWIPLTLRPQFLKHHAGQICLPGGRVESGEDVYGAALREFREELGVSCQVTRFCGELATQYVYASDNRVHPIVAIVETPDCDWCPDPGEVAEVIEVPLATLLDTRNRTTLVREKPVRNGDQVVDRMSFRAPAFRTRDARTMTCDTQADRLEATVTPLASRLIWGATAIILDELAQLLR